MEKNRGLIVLLSSVGVLFAVVLAGLFFFYPRPKADSPVTVTVAPPAANTPVNGTPVEGVPVTATPLDGSKSLEGTPGLQVQTTGVAIDPSVPSKPVGTQTVAFPTSGSKPAKTTPAKPASTPVASPVKPSGKMVTVNEFWIQVGAYKDRYQADYMAKSLEASHMKGTVSGAGTGTSQKYRVRFGPYPNKAEAEKFLGWMKPQKGFDQAYVTEVPAKRLQ